MQDQFNRGTLLQLGAVSVEHGTLIWSKLCMFGFMFVLAH